MSFLDRRHRRWLAASAGGVALIAAVFAWRADPLAVRKRGPGADPIALAAPTEALDDADAASLPPPAAEMPAFDLVDTRVGGSDASALVRARGNQREEWLHTGAFLAMAPDVRLVAVGSDHATFVRAGEFFTLMTASRATPPFRPELDGGHVVGALVERAPIGSLMAALGLTPGDVILSINGAPAPGRPRDVAEALRGAPSLELRVRSATGEVRVLRPSPNPVYGKQF